MIDISVDISIKQALQGEIAFDTTVTIKGWVRNRRDSKGGFSFLVMHDGSCFDAIQVIADDSLENYEDEIKHLTTGCSAIITGKLVKSGGQGQSCEIQASAVEVTGMVEDPETYPVQPKRHTMEFLREVAHLRPRTNTFSAMTRVRNTLAQAVHRFFHQNGFFWISTPIITASDCEGAGDLFRVTQLDLANLPMTDKGAVDYSKDFFGKETYLTVSGQLNVETHAMALSKVYTFGPTFRAENSNTTRHLAEFWMIEPEVAFYELEDNMALAEDFLKYVIAYALKNCKDDLEFLEKRLLEEEKSKPQNERSELALLDKLNFVVSNDFEKLTYTNAVEILKNAKKKFQYPVDWGTDLQSEHERYLVEKHFKKPVILTDYPTEIKAFYMKQSEDGKTVRAMDVLFPGIGEIIGGSQREDNYEKLKNRAAQVGIHAEQIWWYLETRQFGACPHAGFGLGFERLVLFVTGMTNIRDVIPFPRTPKSAEF